MSSPRAELDLGAPSDRSAVIIRARLPPALERRRRQCVANAADGVPAHATLLYPFVAPERLDGAVRALLAGVAARHAPIAHHLAGPAQWPGIVYAALDPAAPFVALHRDLARAFPRFPIYGPESTVDFVPHVTVDESGSCAGIDDRAWQALPVSATAPAIEVITRLPGGRWRTMWRIRLGAASGSGRRRGTASR